MARDLAHEVRLGESFFPPIHALLLQKVCMKRLIPRLLGREGSLHRQLAKGSIAGMLLKVSSVLLSLVLAVILARLLGPAQFGIYSYVLAIAALLAVPAQCGLSYLVLRETARAEARREWGLMRGVWRWANTATALLSLSLVVLGGVIAWLLSERMTQVQLFTLMGGLVLIPFLALGDLRGAALRGLKKVIQGQLPEKVLRPGFLVMLVMLVYVFTPNMNWDASMAMILNVAAAGAAFVVGAILFLRACPREAVSARPIYDHRGFLLSIGPMSVISSAQVLNQYTDILMLGIFLGAEEVGIYRIAMQSAVLIAFVMQAVNMAITPYFVSLHQNNDVERLRRLLLASSKIVIGLTFPMLLILIAFGEHLLNIFFGPSYAGGYHALVVLGLAQFLRAAMGPLVSLLSMTGHERAAMRGILVAAAVNIGCNLVLIPVLGMIGAAISVMLSTGLWALLLWLAVRRSLVTRESSAMLGKP